MEEESPEKLTSEKKSSSSILWREVSLSPPTRSRHGHAIKPELISLMKTNHQDWIEIRCATLTRSVSSGNKFRDERVTLANLMNNLPQGRKGLLRKTFVVRLMTHLSNALHFLHSRGFYSCEVTPTTIEISGPMNGANLHEMSDRVAKKITAKLLVNERFSREDRRSGDSCSVQYRSPESVLIGSDFLSAPSDMWMLGVTLYKLCCGYYPVNYFQRFEEFDGTFSYINTDGTKTKRVSED
jgi:serine/threonine protein kinase